MLEMYIIKWETNITDCCLISFHASQIVSIRDLSNTGHICILAVVQLVEVYAMV